MPKRVSAGGRLEFIPPMMGPATQWVKPGIKARVKHLRGEKDLRHASLQDFWDEE